MNNPFFFFKKILFLSIYNGCGGVLSVLDGQTWCCSQWARTMGGNLVALSKLDILACSMIHVTMCVCVHVCECACACVYSCQCWCQFMSGQTNSLFHWLLYVLAFEIVHHYMCACLWLHEQGWPCRFDTASLPGLHKSTVPSIFTVII